MPSLKNNILFLSCFRVPVLSCIIITIIIICCCLCNRISTRCVGCVCVRAGQHYVSCLPGRDGGCCDVLVETHISASQYPRSSISQMSSSPCFQADTYGVMTKHHEFLLPATPASSDSGPQSCLDVCSDQPSLPTVCPTVSSNIYLLRLKRQLYAIAVMVVLPSRAYCYTILMSTGPL